MPKRICALLNINFLSPVQMLSFMNAQYSLFQQGYNLLDEIDPYMKKLAAEVSSVVTVTTTIMCIISSGSLI